jgi:NhaC family Na+:H+ antiporter
MVIFFFIGIIIASWIFSGTVARADLLRPPLYHTVGVSSGGLLLCSLTSMAIGTSWGTLGTVGLAMMGIGAGMGVPAPVTAGMVISGAFFGDKMSPISDTTNLAAASVGTSLYKHIGAMWRTTFPAYLVSLALFTAIGFSYQGGTIVHTTINLFTDTIEQNFNITPVVLIPGGSAGAQRASLSCHSQHGHRQLSGRFDRLRRAGTADYDGDCRT